MHTSAPRSAAVLAVLLALSTVPLPLAAQEVHREILRGKFQERLERLARDFDGVAGIAVVDLTTDETFGVNEDLVFPQGSAIKIPVLLELFRRAQEDPAILRRRVPVTDDVKVGGSGWLRYLTDGGTEFSVEDLAVVMIQHSDNTATNLLIDLVGMDAVNGLMGELGAPRTRLQRKMIRPDASARGEENLSTPAEAAALMARIARCELPLEEDACARVREILELPKGGPLRAPIPRSVPVAFKPGGIEGVSTAWALVELPDRPYVLTVMANYGGPGGQLVEAVSRAAFEYFSRLARSTEYGTRVPLEIARKHRRGG